MLQSLLIHNYILINHIEIDFNTGFSVITGETGAGKTILMGALSLILGQRADTSVLKDKSLKCIVEGTFNVRHYNLQDYFRQLELDYDDHTIIRREIYPNAKSRAFINDSPVNLTILKELGSRLIDIHSQHQNLLLAESRFQLQLVDSYARQTDILEQYRQTFKEYKKLAKEYDEWNERSVKAKTDLDFFQFQYNHLDEANLKDHEQETLEAEMELQNHAEEIKTNLLNVMEGLVQGEINVLQILREMYTPLTKLLPFYPPAGESARRIEALIIEIKDIAGEAEKIYNTIQHDPEKAKQIQERLDLIYSLQQKHRVSTMAELFLVRDELQEKIKTIASYDLQIENTRQQKEEHKKICIALADSLSTNRNNIIPHIEKEVVKLIRELGMPHASFKIEQHILDEMNENGKDEIHFLFSANKKTDRMDIARVASGGELSRLMLTMKYIVSQSVSLPTILFDEIDTGVSGDMADKMGNMMLQMASSMQVFVITHVPQIAGKGNHHFMVFKNDEKDSVYTGLKLLNQKERINEIAKMLSGKELTIAAVDNAKELLKN